MSIQCNICANYCKIPLNFYGICKQHKNVNNKLIDCSYGVISSASPDPIEKKPLYHFLPTTKTYSIGGIGCNMSCLHCQNYMISHEYTNSVETIKITPETVVENALLYNCKSIAFTYNEPTIHLDFYRDVASLAKGKNLKIVFVSNGYFSDESLDEILKFCDGFNIDLKSFSEKFYREICKAKRGVVLENLKKIYHSHKHLEITNLLINDYNDSENEINELTRFIANDLGCEVPLHFSRSFPYYKMQNIQPTHMKTLENAYMIAKNNGIEYIYIGNAPLNQNSYCPSCGELLIERDGYQVKNLKKIINNKCDNCGFKLNFIM